MNKINPSPRLAQTARPQTTIRNACQRRIDLVESVMVLHPLFDRVIEIKMAKCFQHGQHYHSNRRNPHEQIRSARFHRTVEAPTISGSSKLLEKRLPPSRLNVNWSGMKTASRSSRPKTTNTIIRSRTSEPRITRRLELISKQEDEDE